MKLYIVKSVCHSLENGCETTVYPFPKYEEAVKKVNRMFAEELAENGDNWADGNEQWETNVSRDEEDMVFEFSISPKDNAFDKESYEVSIETTTLLLDGEPFNYEDIDLIGRGIGEVEGLLDKCEDVEMYVQGDCGIDDGLDDGGYLMYQSYDIHFKDGTKIWLKLYYTDYDGVITDLREKDL